MLLFSSSKTRGSASERGKEKERENRGNVRASAQTESRTRPAHLTTAMPALSQSTSLSQTDFRAQYTALVAYWRTTAQTNQTYHSARLLGREVPLALSTETPTTGNCPTASRMVLPRRNTRCSPRRRMGPCRRTVP